MLVENRGVIAAGRRHKAIPETLADHTRGELVEIDVDASPAVEDEPAQIVDAMGVVGMFVRDQNAIEPVDIGVEELLAEIGRGIDQDPRASAFLVAALDQQRAAAPPVFRIFWITSTPAGSRAGD